MHSLIFDSVLGKSLNVKYLHKTASLKKEMLFCVNYCLSALSPEHTVLVLVLLDDKDFAERQKCITFAQ